MSQRRLVFRLMRNDSGSHPPNGYRLATVEEIRNPSTTTAGLRLPLPSTENSNERGRKLYLLDGYMTYRSPDHFEVQDTFELVQQSFEENIDWKVVVKEKDCGWNKGWRTKSSACLSSDGLLLRSELYHHIRLSDQGKKIALAIAIKHRDVEVLYWLLVTTHNEEELKALKFSVRSTHQIYQSSLFSMMKYLLNRKLEYLSSSTFPFQLPLELDSQGETVLDYAIELMQDMIYKNKELSIDFNIRVVDFLVKLFSFEIVDCKNSNDMSFIEMAQDISGGLDICLKLLSISQQSVENCLSSFELSCEEVLLESVNRGYGQLTAKLLDFMTIDASLLMRVLRETARKGSVHPVNKLLELYRTQISVDLFRKDENEKMLTHYAAESDNPEVFELIVRSFQSYVSQWEGEGKSVPQLVDFLLESRDYKGRTPLHIAASKGNKETVSKQLDLLGDDRAKYVKQTDYFGRTALQIACRGGHMNVVNELLGKEKWDLLRERDVNGKTALHYAAQAGEPENAKAICQQLLQSCGDSSKQTLLLWASAGCNGTADEGEGVHSSVRTFLENLKKLDQKTHLLREAAFEENVDMAWELLNRGAEIDDLRNLQLPEKSEKSKGSVENVLHQLELLKDQGRDRPSMEDKLGRNVFAEGLAALFLNSFIESPITVGICGEWGMGKSSLMFQTEKLLLITAAQLTFPNLLKFENFVGAKRISLGTKGRKIYQSIRKGASSLLVQDRSKEDEKEDSLIYLLREYRPQYHAVYKSLACMDSYQMLDSSSRLTVSKQDHALRQAPRILTVQYNAWHYRDQNEAWAGLAVTITKEIENSMTRAQRFSTYWRYSWMKNSVDICIQIFLPCLLATCLAGWIAWVAWILLKHGKFKDLKYGSIPLTIIPIVWTAVQSVMSVVKPVSVQMSGYITKPDHTQKLGYQEQVISDINFLRKELGERPNWFCSFISGEWCCKWLCPDNVENTSIRKFRPASKELRIITFVDDLDRCEEKVVLQVLSAVNLVLARCDINVVMGIDKKMIERAITRSFEGFEDVEGNDLAEKFLCKIIQIPLSLPDPTDDETNKFLEDQLGHKQNEHEILSKDDDSDYGLTDEEYVEDEENIDNNTVELENSAKDGDRTLVLQIESSNPPQTRPPGIIQKVAEWLTYPWTGSSSIPCNISSELKHKEDQSSDKSPLAFSKGARLTREMLISNYSKEEARTFYELKKFATGNQKLPREWKRLLHYHKLAWNILSKRGEVHRLPKWKVELVVWIFICWQWKYEMNTLIKDWSKFTRMANQGEDGNARGRHGPPLSKIVKNCVNELNNLKNKNEEPEGNSAAKKVDCPYHDCLTKLTEALKSQEPRGTSAARKGDRPSHNGWKKLEEALQIQDVSMKGIQLFQQFRLHCETDHLPWPVDDELEV